MNLSPLPKGSVIGVVGNGQLGRMLIQAAHATGYQAWCFGPGEGSPAGQVADREFAADYDDAAALDTFAAGVQVVTFEFENIPASALQRLASRTRVAPDPLVLEITQNRAREKRWLVENGFPVAEHVLVRDRWELEGAIEFVGLPAVLKTADFGYDGKGQTKIEAGSDLDKAWDDLGGGEAVLEAWVDYECEVSVICARNRQGQTRCFPVCHNEHRHHVLALTRVPAPISPAIAQKAQAYAMQAAQALRVVGLLTSEFFITRDGQILFNELAPRPHNSGHFSIDACASSQFAHHVLAITDRPLPQVQQQTPALMANILGDLWREGEPDWAGMEAIPQAHLHLYGKAEARPRRKMGHLTLLGEPPQEILACVERLGREQQFEAPRPPTPAEQLAGRSRDPSASFSLSLCDGRKLSVTPGSLARLRDRWVFMDPTGTMLSFTDEEIAAIH